MFFFPIQNFPNYTGGVKLSLFLMGIFFLVVGKSVFYEGGQ